MRCALGMVENIGRLWDHHLWYAHIYSILRRRNGSFRLQRTGHGVPVHRSRHREDPVKRGSDSLLEAKIKEQITKPRSLTNRAQSLDLTFSFSRISDQSSRLPPPPSPTGSTTDTCATSSPTSGSAPSFPSVYGPPSSLNPVIGAHRHAQPTDLSSTDEVTRVINNLRL
jgi:hypothetical protein